MNGDKVKQILLETIDKLDELEPSVPAGKKKATFELDPQLHRKLKLYAAQHNKNMVEIVEEALNRFFNEK